MANNYQGKYSNSNNTQRAAAPAKTTGKGMRPAAVVKVVVSKGKGQKPEYMDSGIIFFQNTDEKTGQKKGYSIKLRSDVTIPAGTKLSLFLND
jgi:hypothetical protein